MLIHNFIYIYISFGVLETDAGCPSENKNVWPLDLMEVFKLAFYTIFM